MGISMKVEITLEFGWWDETDAIVDKEKRFGLLRK